MFYVIESCVPERDGISFAENAGSISINRFKNYVDAVRFITQWAEHVEESDFFELIKYNGGKLVFLEYDYDRHGANLYHVLDIQYM